MMDMLLLLPLRFSTLDVVDKCLRTYIPLFTRFQVVDS